MALFLVVAFGSCLDVAAIQADTPGQLDYNHELQTVGEPYCVLVLQANSSQQHDALGAADTEQVIEHAGMAAESDQMSPG